MILMLSQSNDVIIPASGETKEDIATALTRIAKWHSIVWLEYHSNANGVFLPTLEQCKEIAQEVIRIVQLCIYILNNLKLNINIPEFSVSNKK